MLTSSWLRIFELASLPLGIVLFVADAIVDRRSTCRRCWRRGARLCRRCEFDERMAVFFKTDGAEA